MDNVTATPKDAADVLERGGRLSVKDSVPMARPIETGHGQAPPADDHQAVSAEESEEYEALVDDPDFSPEELDAIERELAAEGTPIYPRTSRATRGPSRTRRRGCAGPSEDQAHDEDQGRDSGAGCAENEPAGEDLPEPPETDPDDPGPQAELEPETGPRPDPFDHKPTEIDRTREFVDQHGDDLRYCYPRKRWLVWDRRRWTWEAEAEVGRRAEETAKRHLAKEAGYAKVEPERVKEAAKACSVAKRRAMVEGAQHHRTVTVDDLDADPWLLNCRNATIDLRTGQAHKHRREDMITKLVPVRHDPSARAPRWERFLSEVLVTETGDPDPELAAFVRRAVGYSLTGQTGEQALLLLVGHQGANGKSVLLGTLARLLGDYATTIAFGTLLLDHFARNKGPELLPLLGARLATAVEPNAGQRLDESMVKSLTGEDMITVNPKYEGVFSFRPQAKLWLACNTPPRLSSGGDAMARRIRVIPFRRHFSEGEQQRDLAKTLAGELPGILNWAARGCREWQRIGLAPPAAVTLAEQAYQDENDPIAGWLAVHVHRAPGYQTPLTEAHRSYAAWCEGQGLHPVNSRTLAGLLRGHGFTVEKVGGVTKIADVAVTLPATPEQEAGHARGDDLPRGSHPSEREWGLS
jgi:putative DNA primase/helicase